MEGFICISRTIREHWLWQDAEYLKWWLDFLLMSNFENKKVLVGNKLVELKRGQFLASLRYLQDRCAKRDKKGRIISKPRRERVINFLRLLQREGMILYEKRDHQNTIITICNYDKYQLPATTSATTSATKTNKVKEINNKEVVVEDNARAREEKLYEEQLRNDRQIAEITCNNLRITMQQYTGMLEEFFGEQSAKGCVHRNYADFCNHAYNWLRVHRRLNKIDDNGRTDYEQTSHDYRRDAERDAEDAARRDRENALEAMREIARTNGIEFNA